MSEMKAGKVRRAITRADEDEVRRRVARALGANVEAVGCYFNHRDECASVSLNKCGIHCSLLPDEVSGVATVGIFPGATWEIEARRVLPKPWQWGTFEGRDLLYRGVGYGAIAHAHATGFGIYRAENSCVFESFTATSLADARERAEDECWARGLFGVAEDAPPVDRAQAIRDAMIERLTCSPCRWSRLLNTLNGENGGTFATVEEIRAALASIGAVVDGDRWRLSDGPPPGWEWRDGTLRKGSRILARVGLDVCAASVIRDGNSIQWRAEIGTPFHASPSIAEAEADALLVCRRAGLFAPPVATEPTDTPQDAEAQSRPLVAHLNACHRAGWRDGWTADEYAIHLIREGRADKDRFNAERAIVVDREAQLATACTTIVDLEAQIANLVARLSTTTEERDVAMREAASWKDEHGHMHSDRDMQRKRVTELIHQLRATKAERDAARTNETDAGHHIAQMEALLARVTADRDEARLNVVDARAHCASWKRRAEDAEAMVVAMRGVLDAPGKAAP